MTEGEPRRKFRTAVTCLRLWLLSAVAVVLVADLPLSVVYSLKAQLHYLGHFDGRASVAGAFQKTKSLPRSVAFNLEPEAVLHRPAAPALSPAVPPAPFVLPDLGWRVVRVLRPEEEAPGGHPPPRAYDPLAPPFFSL